MNSKPSVVRIADLPNYPEFWCVSIDGKNLLTNTPLSCSFCGKFCNRLNYASDSKEGILFCIGCMRAFEDWITSEARQVITRIEKIVRVSETERGLVA